MADFKKDLHGQHKDMTKNEQKSGSQEGSHYFPQHKETQAPIKNKNSKAAQCTGKCDCNCTSCNDCNCK